MNEQKHQSYKRLFSIIKLINYGIEENKDKDDSRDLIWFVREAVKKEDCDGKLKQQLFDYFCLNKKPKATYRIAVTSADTEYLDGKEVWVHYIQNSKEMANWFGEYVGENVARAIPDVGFRYDATVRGKK